MAATTKRPAVGPFRISWTESETAGESRMEEQPNLNQALRRACALLKEGKAVLSVRRPDGTTLDERQIRHHCSGRWTIIA
jgi:hypothetical protein